MYVEGPRFEKDEELMNQFKNGRMARCIPDIESHLSIPNNLLHFAAISNIHSM
jgi:hypothetical protein